MEFDLKLGSNKETMSKTQLLSAVGSFWKKIYKIIFSVILVGAIILSGYIWRKSLTGGGWSAEKKQEYLDAQNRGVVFVEKDFKEALSNVELRKQSTETNQQPVRDIFKNY